MKYESINHHEQGMNLIHYFEHTDILLGLKMWIKKLDIIVFCTFPDEKFFNWLGSHFWLLWLTTNCFSLNEIFNFDWLNVIIILLANFQIQPCYPALVTLKRLLLAKWLQKKFTYGFAFNKHYLFSVGVNSKMLTHCKS